MKPFRERNPVIIGAISLAAIAAIIMLSFRAQDLPLIGGGDTRRRYGAGRDEAGHQGGGGDAGSTSPVHRECRKHRIPLRAGCVDMGG